MESFAVWCKKARPEGNATDSKLKLLLNFNLWTNQKSSSRNVNLDVGFMLSQEKNGSEEAVPISKIAESIIFFCPFRIWMPILRIYRLSLIRMYLVQFLMIGVR